MWFTRGVLRKAMQYPFEEVGVQLLMAETSEHNKTVRRICRALGCTEHRIERLKGPNEAALVFTLTKEQWAASPLK